LPQYNVLSRDRLAKRDLEWCLDVLFFLYTARDTERERERDRNKILGGQRKALPKRG
jgi:hypothetical protein